MGFPEYSDSYHWHVLCRNPESYSYRVITVDSILMKCEALKPGKLLYTPDLVSYLSCHLVRQRGELWTVVCTVAQGSSYKDSYQGGMSDSVLHLLNRLLLHAAFGSFVSLKL